MKLKKVLCFVALLSPWLLANAHEYTVGELQIEHPWSREVPPVSPNAAVYFGVHNHAADAERWRALPADLAL
jgi:copper(I)-binding protein